MINWTSYQRLNSSIEKLTIDDGQSRTSYLAAVINLYFYSGFHVCYG